MTLLRKIRRIPGGGIPFGGGRGSVPFRDDLTFHMTGERSDNVMASDVGDDVDILFPYYVGQANTLHYAIGEVDSGVLGIGSSDFTICGWVKSESTAKEDTRLCFGRHHIDSDNGRYGFYIQQTTGYLSFSCQSSGGLVYINSDIDAATTGLWYFVRAEINQITNTVHFYVNETQIGTGVAFTGTFNLQTTYRFCIGTNQALSWKGRASVCDIWVFHKLLTSAEIAEIYTNRSTVAGATAHWPCNYTSYDIVYDVIGGRHLTVHNRDEGNYDIPVLYSGTGTRYCHDKGYTLYSNGTYDLQIPHDLDGNEISPVLPFSLSTVEKMYDVPGLPSGHNLASSALVFTDNIFDRSDDVAYIDTLREGSTKYDVSFPRLWDVELLNNLENTRFFKDGYQGRVFNKITDNSHTHRIKIEEILAYSNNKTGNDYIKVLRYCENFVVDGIYETDNIQYKFINENILFTRDDKILKYDSASGIISLSIDGGDTYPHISNIGSIIPQFSFIFNNGNILYSSRDTLYFSDDNLATITPATVLDIGGGAHTGVDEDYMAWSLDNYVIIGGVEYLLWGTYKNNGGAVYIWFTKDNGATVECIYIPEVTNPPNLAGRHFHAINYREEDNSWWVQTGDFRDQNQNNWIRGTYDSGTDTWMWEKLQGIDGTDHFKSVGVAFFEPNVIVSDDSDFKYQRSMWKCAITDLADPNNFECVHSAPNVGNGLIAYDNKMIGIIGSAHHWRRILVSTNNGIDGIVANRIYLPLNATMMRILPPNSNGWHLVSLWDRSLNFINAFAGNVMMVKFKT